MKICEEYPEYRRYCMMRANLRRAHFKQVFEENLHFYVLNQKLLAKSDQKQFEMKHGLYATKKVFHSREESSKDLLSAGLSSK